MHKYGILKVTIYYDKFIGKSNKCANILKTVLKCKL